MEKKEVHSFSALGFYKSVFFLYQILPLFKSNLRCTKIQQIPPGHYLVMKNEKDLRD